MNEAAPFLERIIERVAPRMVFLTGASLTEFLGRYAHHHRIVAPVERDPGVKQIVFSAASAQLRLLNQETLVVQVAHASQFAWTYRRYNVSERALAYGA